MKKNFKQDELSTLSVNLLSTLDESVFFSQIGHFIEGLYSECQVSIYKSFQDCSSQLVYKKGKLKSSSPRLEKGLCIAGYVSKTKRAYYSNNVKRDPLFSMQNLENDINAELCFPLISDGHVIATINVQSASNKSIFSENDLALLKEFVSHLEQPIRNMKMYLMALQMNEELMKKIEHKEKEESSSSFQAFSYKRDRFDSIIGHSSAIRSILKIVDKVSGEDFPVLFEGEAGVGKKLLAHRLHSQSNRHKAPCISLNCATMSDENLEMELFGSKERKGLFELANGGTLIFDEISALSLTLQNKISRALASGEIFSVDGLRNIPINVRIVSSSKESLESLIVEKKFIADLYHRISTIAIKIPSLRERSEDIKYLAEYFLNHNKEKENFKVLTSAAIDMLSGYNWPGNIQELKSVIERTYILSENKYIDSSDLPELHMDSKTEESVAMEDYSDITLSELEKRHIMRSLEHLNGNKTKAAKALGITVKTLYNKLNTYGIGIEENKYALK